MDYYAWEDGFVQIEKRFWGKWNGRAVHLYDFSAGGLQLSVSDCGALLQSLRVKNGRGEEIDAVLGYDTLEEYLRSETFFGAMVGPIADRLARGRCTLAGEEVQLKAKMLVIDEIELLECNLPDIVIRVVCSKGTYIRALARDIGEALQSGAHLTALERTRVGETTLADCMSIEEFTGWLEGVECTEDSNETGN